MRHEHLNNPTCCINPKTPAEHRPNHPRLPIKNASRIHASTPTMPVQSNAVHRRFGRRIHRPGSENGATDCTSCEVKLSGGSLIDGVPSPENRKLTPLSKHCAISSVHSASRMRQNARMTQTYLTFFGLTCQAHWPRAWAPQTFGSSEALASIHVAQITSPPAHGLARSELFCFEAKAALLARYSSETNRGAFLALP